MAKKLICPHGIKTSACKTCRREYDQKKYKANKKEMNRKAYERTKKRRLEFNSNLKGHPCKDCNREFPPWMMDFDHLEDKKHPVAYLISNGKFEEAEAEAKKCDLVCAVCHHLRTILRRGDHLESILDFKKAWRSNDF